MQVSDLDMTVDKGKLLSGGLVFVIPLTVMIWLLLSGVTPAFAACWAIAALILTSWTTSLLARMIPKHLFDPRGYGTRKNLAEALTSGIMASVMTAILLVAIGVMNNAIVTSGVGNSFFFDDCAMVAGFYGFGRLSWWVWCVFDSWNGLTDNGARILFWRFLAAPALAGIMSDTLIVEQACRRNCKTLRSQLCSCWWIIRTLPRLPKE